MKSIETFVLGMVQVNTYLLWNDDHVLVIDPGSKSVSYTHLDVYKRQMQVMV